MTAPATFDVLHSEHARSAIPTSFGRSREGPYAPNFCSAQGAQSIVGNHCRSQFAHFFAVVTLAIDESGPFLPQIITKYPLDLTSLQRQLNFLHAEQVSRKLGAGAAS